METVEVVIKIPKDTFDAIGILQDFVDNKHQIDGYKIKGNSTIGTMIKAIANGTILPKGHGQVDILDKITNLFNRLNNGEIDDNQYYFQMQNLLLFGKELLEVENDC